MREPKIGSGTVCYLNVSLSRANSSEMSNTEISITDVLIADYLKRKGFSDTLKLFEEQSGVNSTTTTANYEHLEDIIDDRTKYIEHSEIINTKTSTNNVVENRQLFGSWNKVHVSDFKVLSTDGSLTIHLSSAPFKISNKEVRQLLFATNSSKKLIVKDLKDHRTLGKYQLHNSVGKCAYAIPNTNRLLSCGMDGNIKLFEYVDGDFKEISGFQLHKRLVTDFRLDVQNDRVMIYSIGWDSLLKIHELKDDKFAFVSGFKLLSNATALELGYFSKKPIALITRLDSSQLAYFSTNASNELYEVAKVSLNDAEFSTHGFTPMSIAITSKELSKETKVAVGTSHIPYMRVIVTSPPDFTRLLREDSETNGEQQLGTPVLRGYILGNLNSLSPQDKYSQARIIWRPDNSGLWISGDDGVIRGLELQHGDIVEELRAHDQRIKCLINDVAGGREVLVSSGIDKKLVFWE